MIEIGSLTALIVAEVMVGLVILSALLLLFTLLRKQRIRKAANHLAERVQADQAKRTERLKTLLEERYQQQGALLEQTLHNMVQTEMMLYQNMLNGFLKDDQVFLQQMDVDVENLVLSYQSLEPVLEGGAQTSGKAAASADGDEELLHLRTENERLSEELKVTMDTMGRMLNEYSSMFSDGVEGFENNPSQVDPAAESAPMEEESPEADGTDEASEEAGDTPDAAQEVAAQPGSSPDEEVVIPEITEHELAESVSQQDDELSEPELTAEVEHPPETAEEVDEEVSEIIDEVMEIADEMIQETEPSEAEQVGESMVDDLDKIDIEIPDMDAAPAEVDDVEAGSLEEEWAKLLEEESSDGEPNKDA